MKKHHFLKEFHVMLCCLDCFKDSLLDNNTLAPFHWAIHPSLEWICFEFFHHHSHFLIVRRASLWGPQEPSFGGRRNHSSLSSLCFGFHQLISLKTLVILVFCVCYFFFHMLIVLVCFYLILVYSFIVLFLTLSTTAVMLCKTQQGM